MTLGNVSVAASLPPVWGLPPAAVGVVTHLARADERRLGALVSAAARDIAKDLPPTEPAFGGAGSHWVGHEPPPACPPRVTLVRASVKGDL